MNQKIIKEGVVTSSPKKLKGGFNLNQFVLEFLKWIGFADTVDCCTYYPTAPRIYADDPNNPNAQDLAGVPDYVLVVCVNRSDATNIVLGWHGSTDSFYPIAP